MVEHKLQFEPWRSFGSAHPLLLIKHRFIDPTVHQLDDVYAILITNAASVWRSRMTANEVQDKLKGLFQNAKISTKDLIKKIRDGLQQGIDQSSTVGDSDLFHLEPTPSVRDVVINLTLTVRVQITTKYSVQWAFDFEPLGADDSRGVLSQQLLIPLMSFCQTYQESTEVLLKRLDERDAKLAEFAHRLKDIHKDNVDKDLKRLKSYKRSDYTDAMNFSLQAFTNLDAPKSLPLLNGVFSGFLSDAYKDLMKRLYGYPDDDITDPAKSLSSDHFPSETNIIGSSSSSSGASIGPASLKSDTDPGSSPIRNAAFNSRAAASSSPFLYSDNEPVHASLPAVVETAPTPPLLPELTEEELVTERKRKLEEDLEQKRREKDQNESKKKRKKALF